MNTPFIFYLLPALESEGSQRTIRRVTGHQKPFDDFTLHDVALHDFRHIGLRAHPIPCAFGIDHHTWPILAMVQASGLIGSYRPLNAKALDLFLKEGMQSFGPLIRTTPTGIALGTLIDADENMMGEGRHGPAYAGVEGDKDW